MFILFLFVVQGRISNISISDNITNVITLQEGTENYTVEVTLGDLQLNNQSVTFIGTEPTCDGINIQSYTDQIIFDEKDYYNLNNQFCAIDDWAPPYQPAHFYLSPRLLTLVLYDLKLRYSITQIYDFSFNTLYENIECMSIFDIWAENSMFAVDCNIQGDTIQKAFILFNLITNQNNDFIIGFNYNTTLNYTYANPFLNNYLTLCFQRSVIPISILQKKQIEDDRFEAIGLALAYVQYCPYNLINKKFENQFDQYYIIEINSTYVSEEPIAYNSNDACGQGQIQKIIPNYILRNYNINSWNLGIFYYNQSQFCKCQFYYIGKSYINYECLRTDLLVLQETYFHNFHTINEEVFFLVGNDYAISILKISQEIGIKDYIDVVYKNIYTPGYKLVGSSVTESYVTVILSPVEINYSDQLLEYCYFNNATIPNVTNIMKLFKISPIFKAVYYELNIPSNIVILDNFNYQSFDGQYLILCEVNKFPQIIIQEVYTKQIVISYTSDNKNICDNDLNITEYFPVRAAFQVNGMNGNEKVSFERYIIVCIISYNNNIPQLVATQIPIYNSTMVHTRCPLPSDFLYYNFQSNQIDLISGTMGPLLHFAYIPNPQQSLFYPFYKDHIEFIQEKYYRGQPFKVYRTTIEDTEDDNQIFGQLKIVSSSEMTKRYVDYYVCQIKSDNQYIQGQALLKLRLSLSDCKLNNSVDLRTMHADYFKQIGDLEFYAQYDPPMLQFRNRSDPKTTDIYFPFDGFQIIQFDIDFSSQEGTMSNFLVTMLILQDGITLLQFLFYQINRDGNYGIDLKKYNQFENPDNLTIFGFQYFRKSQNILSILFNNSMIQFYQSGPVLYIQQPLILNYTTLMQELIVPDCLNSKSIGYKIVAQNRDHLIDDYIIFWCTFEDRNDFSSTVLQYHLYTLNQIYFWRKLPLYEGVVNTSRPVIVSQNILYLPMASLYRQQLYWVYNLLDYSGRMLTSEFFIDTEIDKLILASPTEDLSQVQLSNYQSFAYFLSPNQSFLYYVNTDAQFVFNLNDSSINRTNLTFAIFQPSRQLTVYREYQLYYNRYDNNIKIVNEDFFQINLTTTEQSVSEITGFYNYTLFVNQTIFNGPIVSYEASTDNEAAIVIPGQYYQFNKYIGKYIESFYIYGTIQQMISLSNTQYSNYYSDEEDEIYLDLVIVLTNRKLLFLQTASYKDNNLFTDCEFKDYNQESTDQNNSCSIRILESYNLNKSLTELLCIVELVKLDTIFVACENKLYKGNYVNLEVIKYEYSRNNNSVQILDQFVIASSYIQLFINRYRIFVVGNLTYLLSETTFIDTDSYYQLYTITVENQTVKFDRLPINQFDQPIQESKDFTITLLNENGNYFLVVLILQPYYIRYYKIDFQQYQIINYQNIYYLELVSQIPKEVYLFQFNQKLTQYADVELITFIQTLDSITNYPNIPFLIGNIGFNLEVRYDLTNYKLILSYTFIQDQICQYNIVQKPQFLLSLNGSIEYLVSICLNFQFTYNAIYEQMVYLFGYKNQNLIYTSLFVRGWNDTYSYPVQIIETSVIDPLKLELYNFLLYRSSKIQGYQPHILMTNYTYFLVDFFVYPDQTYTILYPNDTFQTSTINVQVVARNQITQNYVTYQIQLPYELKVYKSIYWFYFIIALLGCSFVLALFSYLRHQYHKFLKFNLDKSQFSFAKDNEHIDQQELEMRIANLNNSRESSINEIIIDAFRRKNNR